MDNDWLTGWTERAGDVVAVLGHAATPPAIGGTLLGIVFAMLLDHLQHSRLWITLGARRGRRLLAPAHHRIHHSDGLRHRNRTISDARAIFDRRFGSFRVPAPTREMARLGVDDDTHDPHGIRAALLDPFTADARAFAPRPAIAR